MTLRTVLAGALIAAGQPAYAQLGYGDFGIGQRMATPLSQGLATALPVPGLPGGGGTFGLPFDLPGLGSRGKVCVQVLGTVVNGDVFGSVRNNVRAGTTTQRC